MSEPIAPHDWATDIKNRIIFDDVTVDGTEVRTYHDDVFVKLGTKYPQLRDPIVQMFQRFGNSTVGKRYPNDLGVLAEMDLTPEALEGLTGLIESMPNDDDEVLDRAVAALIGESDREVSAVLDADEAPVQHDVVQMPTEDLS